MRKAELKKRAYELHLQEYSYGEIATELNKPRSTVYRWVNSEYENQVSTDGAENDTARSSSGTGLNINETISKQTGATLNQNIDKKVSYDTEITPIQAEIAAKKVANDHEFRMKEVENNKQKELLLAEIDKLVNFNAKLQQNNKLLSKRNSLLIKLQHKMSFKVKLFRERNLELEDEVSMLCDPAYVPDDESDNPSIPASFVNNITEMIEEYLELERTNCDINTFDLTVELAEVLESEIRDNAIEYGFDTNDDEAMIILTKFIKDLKSVHNSLNESGRREIKLIINSNWRQEMLAWVKTVD